MPDCCDSLKSLRPALPAVLLCLGLNAVLFVGITGRRPDYLSDYRLNQNPDAHHYVLLGRNLFLHGSYSRSDGPPFVPDMLRTPVYPVFAGGLDLLGGAGAIYAAQVLLHVGSCLLLFRLARELVGERAAVWASLFLASDVMVAVSNFEAMSEPLFLFLLLAAAVCLWPVRGLEAGQSWLWRLLSGGALLGLAVLTRPAALYLPVIVGLAYLFSGWSLGRLKTALLQLSCCLLPFLALVGGWVARNAATFGLAKVTTVDTQNLVYFTGAGAYQVRFGITLEDAQQRIAEEFHVVPYRVAQNDHVSGRSAKEINEELRARTWDVLRRYPGALLKSSLLGLAKASVSHCTEQLAWLVRLEWTAPGTGGLLRGDGEAYARLGSNPPVLIAAFGWQLLHTAAGLLLAAVGAWRVLRERATRGAGLLLLLLLAYFWLTVALFGYDAFYRSRIPALPFLFVLAGVGIGGPRRDILPPSPGTN
jgi:4-amino-4-deoxy-L-arabinose transferase-like glycosyltransferase